jgi:ribosome-binding factor A
LGYTEDIALEVEMTEDEMYRVSLTRDGISATTYVSSMHLVEDKKRQLLLAIEREAARSYAGWA